MRALAISDMHFGAWTGDPVLSRDFALGRLAPQLEDVDELILLGDVFDFLFSSVDHAFEQAGPFFDLVADHLRGRRVVFLAGNHDHHIVVRAFRTLVELGVATGAEGAALSRMFESEYRSFFQRYLDRRLPGVETAMAYPACRFGDALLCHGHYLDAHMGGSVPNRLLTRAIWGVAGGRPADALRIEDYESVIVPLTELLFTVAQMPRGTAAQRSFHHQLERVGRVLQLASAAQREATKLRARLRPANGHLNGAGRARPRRTPGVARACRPHDPPPLALEAYAQVVRNLGWHREASTFVFAHTHQPLDGVAHGDMRFWNTGSWIYEPSLGSAEDYAGYLARAWPGTAVVLDTDAPEPRLLRLLEDQNPLNGGGRDGSSPLRPGTDAFTERAARYATAL